jgi:hypothetical protein
MRHGIAANGQPSALSLWGVRNYSNYAAHIDRLTEIIDTAAKRSQWVHGLYRLAKII